MLKFDLIEYMGMMIYEFSVTNQFLSLFFSNKNNNST